MGITYTMTTAKDMITKTGGTVSGNVIRHKRPGIKVLGAIDYLVHNCKHIWQHDTEKEAVKSV